MSTFVRSTITRERRWPCAKKIFEDAHTAATHKCCKKKKCWNFGKSLCAGSFGGKKVKLHGSREEEGGELETRSLPSLWGVEAVAAV